MKRIIFTAIIAVLSFQGFGQFLPTAGGTMDGNLILATGVQLLAPYYGLNAGFAPPTTSASPAVFWNSTASRLDIVGSTNGWGFVPNNTSSYPSPVVSIDQNGNVTITGNSYTYNNLGVATNTPAGRINVVGKTNNHGGQTIIDDNGAYIPTFAQYKWTATGSNYCQTTIANSLSTRGSMDFQVGAGTGAAIGSDAQTTRMTILPSGNVLIGKTSENVGANYMLDVNGTARMNAITVNTTGADFVFEPKYQLMPLIDLEKYLSQNHHLPGIAPAQQMQANGLNLGENQTLLLQKVEELTLYLIEKDKQLTEEKQKNEEQEARISKLEAQMQELIKAKQ